jgi:hypothetical protein
MAIVLCSPVGNILAEIEMTNPELPLFQSTAPEPLSTSLIRDQFRLLYYLLFVVKCEVKYVRRLFVDWKRRFKILITSTSGSYSPTFTCGIVSSNWCRELKSTARIIWSEKSETQLLRDSEPGVARIQIATGYVQSDGWGLH